MTWVEQLRAHEAICRRAPSAHNTQPWRPVYHADEIVIGVDPARSLPDSDPTGRDLALGTGAFVETCLIVSADLGLAVTAAPGPRLVPAAQAYATPFTIADIESRRVARGPYAPGYINAAVVADLGLGVAHVPARDLAQDLAVADRWLFGTPAVAVELRDWLRLDPRHPRYRLDGLTDRALVLSRYEARFLAAALRAYPVTRRLGLAALLAASGRSLLRYEGSVLVLLADGDDRIAAGQRLLRTWLALARHGLAVHPLSQLIDCPATAGRLAERVGGQPLAVFRVGRPLAEPVRSARL
jgi:nitroreductase